MRFIKKENTGCAAPCFLPPLIPANAGPPVQDPPAQNPHSWPQIRPVCFAFATGEVVRVSRKGISQKKCVFFIFFSIFFSIFLFIPPFLRPQNSLLNCYLSIYPISMNGREPARGGGIFFFFSGPGVAGKEGCSHGCRISEDF